MQLVQVNNPALRQPKIAVLDKERRYARASKLSSTVKRPDIGSDSSGLFSTKFMDDEYESSRGFLDSQQFHAFTLAVGNTIRGRMTIGDIRRAMGSAFRDTWIHDALSNLEAAGTIRKVWSVPSRWEPNSRQMHQPSAVTLPKSGRPTDKTRPAPESYHFKKEQTA